MMANFRSLKKALKEGFKIRRQFGGTYSVFENGESVKYVVTDYAWLLFERGAKCGVS